MTLIFEKKIKNQFAVATLAKAECRINVARFILDFIVLH